MKANEFIKKYGIEYAIKFLNYDASIAEDRCVLDFGEHYYLRRLVESHELVDAVGGMDKAKLLLRMRIAAELYDSAHEIEQAILDVESCQ